MIIVAHISKYCVCEETLHNDEKDAKDVVYLLGRPEIHIKKLKQSAFGLDLWKSVMMGRIIYV